MCNKKLFRTLLLSSFWTSRGHRCRPFPPVLALIFYLAQGSAPPLLVDFSSSVANSRSGDGGSSEAAGGGPRALTLRAGIAMGAAGEGLRVFTLRVGISMEKILGLKVEGGPGSGPLHGPCREMGSTFACAAAALAVWRVPASTFESGGGEVGLTSGCRYGVGCWWSGCIDGRE